MLQLQLRVRCVGCRWPEPDIAHVFMEEVIAGRTQRTQEVRFLCPVCEKQIDLVFTQKVT